VDREAFLKKLRGDGEKEVIDFEAIIPSPDNMFTGNLGDADREQCAREGRPNWYDWQVENWGTKWNAYEQSFCDNGYGELEVSFDTAWSAPFPIIAALREWDEIEWVGGNYVEEFCESAGVF